MAAFNFTKKCRNELQTQTDQKTLLCVGATKSNNQKAPQILNR
jgi:hypothetical protein